MTIEVVETDLIEGSAFSWSSTDGVTLSRAFMVTGIEGNASAKMWLAANANGIPNHRDEHPDILGSYVVNKTVNMKGISQAEIIVEYAPFKSSEGDENNGEQAYRTKRISGSVQSVQTNRALEFYGKSDELELMNVEYEWPDAKSPTGQQYDKQVGTVQKEDAILTMQISTTETTDPFFKILEFQGTMNSRPWSNGGPRKWFLRNIDSSTSNGGVSWEVTYSFQFKQDLWDVDVAYIDPRTGTPPADAGDAAGKSSTGEVISGLNQTLALRPFRIYRMTDFKKLGIGG